MLTRRVFLGILLAGLAACSAPPEQSGTSNTTQSPGATPAQSTTLITVYKSPT